MADDKRKRPTDDPDDASLQEEPSACEDADDDLEDGDGDGDDASTGGATAMPDDPGEDDDELRQLLAGNFLEYASYVIKDRAIPDVDDGLKPVQRRILHSMHVMDDGRYHKVANIIGHTMQFHPHGDASIGNALVVLANKEFFIDRQGNFGNIMTGDPASAARYIECRLTPLAKEVLFNREITTFADSYDGRNQEPVVLPAKVPALLMLGAEGIAVGMTTRVLPHNFQELLQAQIAILRNQPFRVFPDFLQGGLMDVTDYDDGRGRIILRALIEADSDKRLLIREIPATTTTESLIASIEDAAKRNKIKIATISDYTAESVEIEITLPRGAYTQETIKQLYAYTDCEVSISSTLMVICNNLPVEMTVSEVLKRNTEKLVYYLKSELELLLGKLQERFHEKTLVQIFIENRIYKRIEEAETHDSVVQEVRQGLEPFREMLTRDVTDEDIDKLLQIQIRRISRFDINRNQEELEKIVADMKETRDHLKHLVDYTVAYIENLLEKYGEHFPRRTRLKDIEQVDARQVALRNLKVGHDRAGQFVGSDIKPSNKSESPLLCSEFDRLVLLRNDGVFKVIPIPDKQFIGPMKLVLRADKEQIYSMIYRDRKTNAYYAKRFRIDSYVMDREYNALPKNCIIEAFYTNHGTVVSLKLVPNKRRQVDDVIVVFEDIEIRSARARGFKVTGYPVESLNLVERGQSEPFDEQGEDQDNGENAAAVEERQPANPGEKETGASQHPKPLTDPAPDAPANDADEDEPASPDDASGEQLSEPPLVKDKDGARRIAEEWQRRTREAKAVNPSSPATGPVDAGDAQHPAPTDTRADADAAPKQDDPRKKTKSPAMTPKNDPPHADTDATEAKPSAQKASSRRPDSVKKLIDEETPFFLE